MLDVINCCLKSTRYLLYVKGDIFLSCLLTRSCITAGFALLMLERSLLPAVYQVREFVIAYGIVRQRELHQFVNLTDNVLLFTFNFWLEFILS
jgi:hypothetical protein